MGIIELVTKIGEANIGVQNLRESIDGNITLSKKGVTRLSILTTALKPVDLLTGEGKHGLIIWFDKDKLP